MFMRWSCELFVFKVFGIVILYLKLSLWANLNSLLRLIEMHNKSILALLSFVLSVGGW